MTSNQINMLRHLEEVRHNETVELEQMRSNKAKEGETRRSNIMSERLKSLELAETSRHNLYSEYIGQANALETQRHNKEVESEANRHNKKEESMKEYLLEPQKNLWDAQAGATGINAFVNAGKAVGSLIGWLAQG